LAARSQFGYVDRIELALPREPEAIDADYQRQLSRRAHVEALVRQRHAA